MTPEFEQTEETITLHGLGFLQIKLQGAQRLHVWHPELPRRACFADSAIHDHRFGFVSRVLVGTQVNVTYDTTPASAGLSAPTHVAYLHEGARTQYGNRPWLPDGALTVTISDILTVPAGDEYPMAPYVYHSTQPGGDGRVATLMRKTTEGRRGAHSLCAIGVEPDADFDRKQWPEDRLWRIVRDVLGGAR